MLRQNNVSVYGTLASLASWSNNTYVIPVLRPEGMRAIAEQSIFGDVVFWALEGSARWWHRELSRCLPGRTKYGSSCTMCYRCLVGRWLLGVGYDVGWRTGWTSILLPICVGVSTMHPYRGHTPFSLFGAAGRCGC